MTAKIERLFGTVSLPQIKDFESRKNLSLPDTYMRFLLRSNGGHPVPCEFDVPNWPGDLSGVDVFFGIQPGERCSLEWWFDELEDTLPEGFIAIAVDPCGNFLCMGTTGEYRAKIYYWDSSNDYDIPEDQGNMFPVANDIEEFLEKLR